MLDRHSATKTTQHLWDSSSDIYRHILAHPFLAQLVDGTLPHETFRHYVVQDGLYLQDYSLALRGLAANAPDPAVARMFDEHADNAIAAETALHAELLAELAPSGEPERSPTTLAYSSYLLATVRGGSFADGLAAVLPCYLIYWEVGRTLAADSSPDPLYARWIETYGSPGFGEIAEAVIDVVDHLDVARAVTDRMQHHFRIGARFEWMFWDAAYRREGWPV